jgi:hypothetical protein
MVCSVLRGPIATEFHAGAIGVAQRLQCDRHAAGAQRAVSRLVVGASGGSRRHHREQDACNGTH